MTKHAFENRLRTPYELLVSLASVGFGLCISQNFTIMMLSEPSALCMSIPFFILAAIRGKQGLDIIFYKKRLVSYRSFEMTTSEVPLSQKKLFLGRGFKWLPIHRQRLHLLSSVHNQKFLEKNTHNASKQALGGKPWLHGVGIGKERSVFLNQNNRNAHTVVFGMTRVGKTRLMSILVNQDIRNGEAVLVIDPKGDLDLMRDIRAASISAGRLDNFMVLHAGFPEESARYNPLAEYSNISEIATRVTSAIQAEGEGKQFQDFAWKFLNITSTCLVEMGEPINYKSLSFFVTRPKQLLLMYCEKIISKNDQNFERKIDSILTENNEKLSSRGRKVLPMTRTDAVQQYVSAYIEDIVSAGNHQDLHNSIIADLHYASTLGDEYYGKITASLGPVFDKINKTTASDIFSWDETTQKIIKLDDAIKSKKIIYIGLDSLTNKAMSDAVGQAVISDLVSLCGRLYKSDPDKSHSLCLHADEFSEIVRDEFVTLLNKAGGAGIKVSAYTQTLNDLGAAFKSNQDKAKMLLGNFGSMIMMRVANQDTAKVFTECLEKIRARTALPSTKSNDKSNRQSGDGELFTTVNSDDISEEATEIIVDNDVFSLPKGQAFVLTNGGDLFKIRIPLPKMDPRDKLDFTQIIKEANNETL